MKEIKLLEQQLEKLKDKEFDLDAWKQYTVVLLARIFGDGNPKINQIEKIEYDFSSWALRDTTGKSEYLETCRKLGREIIQASIDELKAFGLPDPDKKQEGYIPAKIIEEALEEDLKISQLRKLLELINADKSEEDKKKEIESMLKSFDKSFPVNFALSLLSNAQLKGKF